LVRSPTGSINLSFTTEGILAVVLIITFSWGLPTGWLYTYNIPTSTQHHQQVFWRRCQGERRFLQGESLASNLLLCYCFALFYFCLHLFIKNTKKTSSYFKLLFMSSLVSVTMSPEEMIFTFKQKGEESFKEAWSRIYDCHGKTEPKMTLSLLLSSFYFGLALRYKYALDATAGGDFLHCDGDQAFNIIKKLIVVYSLPSDFDSSLVSIFARLNTLDTQNACLKDCYVMVRCRHPAGNPKRKV
jgi:hypothetical protein